MFKRKRNEVGIHVLASNIRRYRQTANLTIEELANLVDVDYSQISRMERGTINPGVSIIFDIAKVLNIPASKLLEENNP